MRSVIMGLAGIALVASFASGCGEDTPEPTIIVSQQVKDFTTGDGLNGVTVCIHGRSDIECSTTDAAGNYTIEVPADKDLSFSFERSDYWPMLVETHTPAQDWDTIDDMNMNSELEVELLLASSNLSVDSEKGHLLINAFDSADITDASGLAEVSVTIDGGGGTLGYVAENALVETDLTSTTFRGASVIINIDPGVYTVTLSHPTLTCKPMYAVAGAEPNTFRTTVIPVAVTWLNAYCD